MDKFRTVLDFANKQTNLGFGLVALLTAGGEQVFSSAVFNCPCSDLNFLYGMVFLLVPALALLLLGYILSKKTWKLLTGVCSRRRSARSRWKSLTGTAAALFQISSVALVAPSSWIAVALLNGNYYECAMTGTNVSAFEGLLCGAESSRVSCRQQLHRFPCGTGSDVPKVVRDDVLLALRAQSQLELSEVGWRAFVNSSFQFFPQILDWIQVWKTNLRPSLRSLADSIRFSSRMVLYLAPCIFPSILTIFPVPAEEKQAQTMMPPPCLTVGMVCSG
uniref:calcium homeostasis modulator protein 6 isoform X2 n=1 Tax=Gasterosteus aculeatus aculeatus TaxID=481459 RepID=UPI001A98596D|nr:calcium homeostasis modulator protein 6 isoform X2 [Gasterosteus aculeatus aculeatus]